MVGCLDLHHSRSTSFTFSPSVTPDSLISSVFLVPTRDGRARPDYRADKVWHIPPWSGARGPDQTTEVWVNQGLCSLQPCQSWTLETFCGWVFFFWSTFRFLIKFGCVLYSNWTSNNLVVLLCSSQSLNARISWPNLNDFVEWDWRAWFNNQTI